MVYKIALQPIRINRQVAPKAVVMPQNAGHYQWLASCTAVDRRRHCDQQHSTAR
jgi:hypothetical protein